MPTSQVEDADDTSQAVVDILEYSRTAIPRSAVVSTSHLAVRPESITEHRGLWQVREHSNSLRSLNYQIVLIRSKELTSSGLCDPVWPISAQRNAALVEILLLIDNGLREGIVYFADDDNTYDSGLFDASSRVSRIMVRRIFSIIIRHLEVIFIC